VGERGKARHEAAAALDRVAEGVVPCQDALERSFVVAIALDERDATIAASLGGIGHGHRLLDRCRRLIPL